MTGLAEPESESDRPESDSVSYRPHLDGLRALAVYLVLLFHAGSGWFPGGYVGVDVFFVLSGFLVTQLLLRDIVARDSIRLGRFYSRRFRRLLPAAFVALTVTAVAYTAIASPAEVSAAVGSFKAAFLYSTNWYFIHQSTGYFGADITTNPVLHFWSLAVEEQFYLLWPMLLGGAFVLTRRIERARRTRVIAIGVAVAAFASAVWALSLRNSDPNHAYYGTDTRAYELFAGALLALVPASMAYVRNYRRSAKVATVAAVGSLLIVASSWFDLDAIERGVAVTIITCALIVGLEAADGGVVKRILSTPTAVYLGKISYGTYLWHWLVILVAIRSFHLSALSTIGVSALVATALAALSYELLEHPIRSSQLLDRHRRVVIATGLAVSLVAGLALIPAIVKPARATTPGLRGSTVSGFTPVPTKPDWRSATSGNGEFPTCLHKPVDKCGVVRGSRGSILLIGDSHARMLVPTFTEIARKEHLTLWVSVYGACPWQRDLYAHPLGGIGVKSLCKARKDDIYDRLIPTLKPDIVVGVDLGYGKPGLLREPFLDEDGKILTQRRADRNRWPELTTTRSVNALRAAGAKVLIVEPIPVAPFDPRTCLSQAKVLESCRYTAPVQPDALELFYRGLDHRYDDVWSANFDPLVCPFLPICDPIVQGQVVKADRTHLSDEFAKTLADSVDTYLKQSGILAR